MSLTLPSPLNPTIATQWQSLLSLKEETKHKDNLAFWTNAQNITIIALCALGAAILLSPHVFPITYTSILTNAFAIVPLLLPIPGYFYNYFTREAKNASNLAKKLIFCRITHPLIESTPQFLEITLEETFGEFLSDEKKAQLTKTKNIHTQVLSHIAFLKSEIKALEIKKEEMKFSISSYKENDLRDLLTDPLFSNSKDLILEALESCSKDKNKFSPLNFLQSLTKSLKEDPSNHSEALIKLKKLSYEWNSKDSLSLSRKWAPFFEIEEKIVAAQINQLFLWTFLFRPEEDFEAELKKYKLEIENSLSDYPVKKSNLTFADTAVGALYNESSINNALTLPDNEIISKEELLNPEKRMLALDKLIKAALNKTKNDTYPSTFS